MKPKITIPKRTPESDAYTQHLVFISNLYNRWTHNQLEPEDAWDIIKYHDDLVEMKKQHEWRKGFDQKHMEWKVAQSTLKNTDDNNNT